MLMIKSMISILMLMWIIMFVLIMIYKKSMSSLQKMSPFECGFNPMSNKRMPFSIHFFMIAIIFLIFDVEIIIIMPMILSMKYSMIKFWSTTCIMFSILLIMGLYYEWYNGLLNWTK
uniref:NADH-ubiquinone oxidoreductase chain 3 n=1 Tax=Hypsauchenia hardwickii TaxID=2605027 RepID=A0A5B9T3V2_9HEMI|nr:NADH dehydrogenase subunit 3 [Hypsauchenia hardwickii]QEG98437.1 NADH dehydrogenase subunit 3 [Hypsauchenia hardwickii]